jgi:hypothetical protein
MGAARISDEEVRRIATLPYDEAATTIISWGQTLVEALTSVARDLRHNSDQIEIFGDIVTPEASVTTVDDDDSIARDDIELADIMDTTDAEVSEPDDQEQVPVALPMPPALENIRHLNQEHEDEPTPHRWAPQNTLAAFSR